MTRHLAAVFLGLVVSATLLAQAPPPASPDVLLKAALQKEQIDNDLPAAIVQYKAIVDKFPKDAAAARALLQMAGIYARKGEVGAEREAYERIARDHPDSGAPAAAARQRLGSATSSRFKETELIPTGKADAMLGSGRVSPDGRYISFDDSLITTAGGTGNLAMWEIASDKSTIVNKFSNQVPWAEGWSEGSAWSPDSRTLAYAWRVRDAGMQLRTVDIRTGRHQVIYNVPDGWGWFKPMAWSPDRRRIAVAIGKSAGEGTVDAAEVALIDVAAGTRRTLKSFNGSLPGNAVFSRDGGFLAFDFQPHKESPARDISVLAIDSGQEARLTDDRDANDVLLGWFADGHVLFASDRGGEVDAYTVRVRNGAVEGTPVVTKRGIGEVQPQGVTTDGRVLVIKTAEVREIYVAELDPVTGKATKPPAPLGRQMPAVKRREPAWSPDGARIAYVQSAPGVPESIVVQTVATNDVRVYPVSVRNIDWPLWQRDGRAFIFDGTGEDNVQRTFKLDLGTGRVEAFGDAVVFGISPDGRAVYEGGNTKGLVRRNLSDNSTSVLLPPGVGPGGGRTLSPDGRWFAFLRPTRPGARVERPGRSLFIQSASGGEERVLVSDFRAGYARLAWTPDSRFVICEVVPNGLHRVPIDGGALQALDVKGLGMITEKSMNADGRRLAFAISRNRSELWVWENVIPKGKQP